MLPVVDKPLIHYAVEEARAAGVEHFVFVTGRGKGAMEDYFDHAFELEAILERGGKKAELALLAAGLPEAGEVSFVRQQEPAGLGHAVWCARAVVGDEPFAVILPDDLVMASTPCLKQLVDVHGEKGGNVVAVENVPREHVNRYGVLDVSHDDGRLAAVKGLVEKPSPDKAPSTLSIIGRYILQPEIFEVLDRKERGAGGEIQLTDAMQTLMKQQTFTGVKYKGQSFDCGSKVGFLTANVVYALDRPDIAKPFIAELRKLKLI
jgi:UTP--glucose-1-phosphate uridylyltransferase